MKAFFKTIFIMVLFSLTLSITSCSNKNEKKVESIKLPDYSEITVAENKDGQMDTFKVENGELHETGSFEKLLSLVYNLKEKTYVNSISASKDGKSNYNKLEIITEGKNTELNDFYEAIDLKLNSSADKLAFRAYKDSSLDSAEGMKIYDLKNNQYVKLKSKVLVSGNIYDWIDKNRIIYYGTIEGEPNSDKIYEYDLNSNKETTYLQDMDGYCMYLVAIKQNILFLVKQGDTSMLCYYDKGSNLVKNIENGISNIYDSVVNYQNGDVYFLASENEGDTALYKFSSDNLNVERITYDFPKSVDISSGIAMDSSGNVYFCGLENPDEKYKKDVFMYNVKEKSTDLISTHQGDYSLYSDKSNS